MWLTLDSWWTYRADGVFGCTPWVDQPTFKLGHGWSSPSRERGIFRIGKKFESHPEMRRVDAEIIRFFLPDIDQKLDRQTRFRLVSDMREPHNSFHTQFSTSIQVAPHEWINWALSMEEDLICEARHSQKYFDNPF